MAQLSVIMFGPLFSLAERRFNDQLAAAINRLSGARLWVILPQDEAENFKTDNGYDFEKLYLHNLANAGNYQLAVAILDGSDADSGTCLEIGYRKGQNDNNIVVGVCTDFRGSEDGKVNAMLRICDRVIEYFGDDLNELADLIINTLFELVANKCDLVYLLDGPTYSISSLEIGLIEVFNKKRPHLD